MQGWTTLQIIRDPAFARGYLSARSVTGFLSDVYSAAADELGKIYLIADERVCFYNTSYLFHYSAFLRLIKTNFDGDNIRFKEQFLIFQRRLQKSC